MPHNKTVVQTSLQPDSLTSATRIRSFELKDSDAFRHLNERWITELFGLEDEDRRILSDPMNQVVRTGGYIYVAESEDRVVACCALVFLRAGVYEVAKMSVSEEVRGQGLGRRILTHVIAEARRNGSKELELATNTRLADAIHLYESLGFRHLPPERISHSVFSRANVFMEMRL